MFTKRFLLNSSQRASNICLSPLATLSSFQPIRSCSYASCDNDNLKKARDLMSDSIWHNPRVNAGFAQYDQKTNATTLIPGPFISNCSFWTPIKIGVRDFYIQGEKKYILDFIGYIEGLKITPQLLNDNGHWEDGKGMDLSIVLRNSTGYQITTNPSYIICDEIKRRIGKAILFSNELSDVVEYLPNLIPDAGGLKEKLLKFLGDDIKTAYQAAALQVTSIHLDLGELMENLKKLQSSFDIKGDKAPKTLLDIMQLVKDALEAVANVANTYNISFDDFKPVTDPANMVPVTVDGATDDSGRRLLIYTQGGQYLDDSDKIIVQLTAYAKPATVARKNCTIVGVEQVCMGDIKHVVENCLGKQNKKKA